MQLALSVGGLESCIRNFVKIERMEITRIRQRKSIWILFFRALTNEHAISCHIPRLGFQRAGLHRRSRMNDRRGDVDTRSSISWRHIGGGGARRSCYDRATVMWPIGTRRRRLPTENVDCVCTCLPVAVAKRRVARSRRRLLAVASLGVYPGLHSGRFCRITSREIFAESPLTTFEHLPAKRIFLRVKLTWRDSRIYYRDTQLAHNHYRRHNCIHVVLCFWSVSSNLNFNSRFFNLNFYSYF